MTAIAWGHTTRRPVGRAFSALGPAGAVAAVVLGLLLLMAALAPWIAPYSPDAQDLANPFQAPSSAHWLGTDSTGRDIASRLIWGARTSLAGPAAVVALSVCAGIPVALLAAWFGGRIDAVVARVLDVLFALPGILIAVLAVSVFGTGLSSAVIALAVAYLPYVARTARAVAIQQHGLPYVAALKVQGLGGFAISLRHVLPNIAPVVMAQVPVAFALALVDLAALSFLGLAVQAPQADWGVLVSDSQAVLQGHPEQVIWAGSLIVVAVLSLTFLGDRISEGRPEPRIRTKKRRRTDAAL